jgi:hypothetical protein
VSDEVDLVIVQDHALSVEICKALKHAGIHHVEFWPEDILDPSIGIRGHGFMEPVFRLRPHESQGPFHIRVREEDLHDAQFVLLNSGLKGI